MSWMVHFNGEDYGPLTDSEYVAMRRNLNATSQGGCYGFRFPAVSNDDIASVETSTGVVVREFFWTPGAPISFTHIAD